MGVDLVVLIKWHRPNANHCQYSPTENKRIHLLLQPAVTEANTTVFYLVFLFAIFLSLRHQGSA